MRNTLWIRVMAVALVVFASLSFARGNAVNSLASMLPQTTLPTVQWFTPNIIPLGQTNFIINGTGFQTGAVAFLDGIALPMTYLNATQLRATTNVMQSSSGYITILNPGATAASKPYLIEFGEGIKLSLNPATATVAPGGRLQFTPIVNGTANKVVYWYVSGGGSISQTGLYVAPLAAQTTPVRVRIVSAEFSARQATATLTIAGTAAPVQVSVSPLTANVPAATARQFTALVTGSTNKAVTWQVNNLTNGNATFGTISNNGYYVAPALALGSPVTIKAISKADTTKSATATVMVIGGATPTPMPTATPTPMPTATPTPMATATPTPMPTATPTPSPTATPTPSPTATPTATPTPSPSPTPTPTPGTSPDATTLAAARLLEQTTFGPTAALINHVKQIGAQAWLDEQFNTPESTWPNGINSTHYELQDGLYMHQAAGQDQLRQRVLHALTEILVISRNKNNYPNMLYPWLQILSRNSFGNYKTLLKEITLDATMGNYLDMVNSAKPGVSGGANENYPRELMQLFSIGLYELNLDGTFKLDAAGKPIPTYAQNDVRQIALALTGWTFNRAGSPPVSLNSNYYPGQMFPLPAYHDTSSKTFLGATLPANQPMQKDVDDVIEIIFNHPNVAPFVAVRMIRGLVVSNPSPAYIARVAAVFNDNGQGVRGDLKAVIRAVLLDPEARNDNPGNDFGKLRSPLLHTLAMFRLLGATISNPSNISYDYELMNEAWLNAPSVFGHYSPLYRIPRQTPPLVGPEFQIFGPGELILRGNFLWNYMSYYQTGIWNLQWLFDLGNNHTACINAVDNLLLYGRMSAGLRQSLQTALAAQASVGADAKTRALTVLYLTAMSSEYMVMH